MSNERTAIDTALIKLSLASQYLEVHRPSKQDVKKSSEAAKDAAEILKAIVEANKVGTEFTSWAPAA